MASKTFPAVKKDHQRATVKAGDGLSALFESVPKKKMGELKGAMVREKFAQAIVEEYGVAAAIFVLEHIQGVYVIKDDAPTKASATGPVPVYLYVYTTEAMLKADLDGRQEKLKRRLRERDIYFDRLKPRSSTGDMRSRTPYTETIAQLREQLNVQQEASQKRPTSWTPETIAEAVSGIDNPDLADAITRAMTATLL